MSLRRPLVLIAFAAILALVLGCSGGNNSNPVTSDGSANSMDSLPIIGLTDANGVFDAIGVLGFFELNLDPETMVAELTAPRMASVGESFVVSAAGFFTVAPCPDCLDVKSLDIMPDGTIKVTWNISHPFPYGDDTLPPKANNRRDLDLFDLAMVIAPTSEVATAFSTGGVYTQICADPDGYTAELATVVDAPTWACPYFLVIDESNAAPVDVTNNRFLMGTLDLEFDTLFNAGGKFKVYLTCGYGAAAKKATFLSPTYFIPEFNRKAAWKVVVTPPNGNDAPSSMNTWNNTNNDPVADVHTVKVEVYDWQQNSPIFSGDPLAYGTDAAVNEIYAASAVSQVTLEIPGMFNSPGYKIMNTADSGTGAPLSPLVFNFNVVNETLLPVGVYPSLVKVTDSRPGQDPLGQVETRDWVIDSPDGIALNHSALSEFAVYQVFDSAVVQFCGPITGSILTPSPVTGVFDDGYAMVSALATSTNGGAPIVDYEWDMEYDGITFDVDKHGANAALGPYDNPNCGGTDEPVIYTAACRAVDSCVPPNKLILGTIDVSVDDCSGAPIVPVTPVAIPSGDTVFDVAVAPGGYVYLFADHPATGNTGGTSSPNGTRTALQYPNDLSSMAVINPGVGIVDLTAYPGFWDSFPGESTTLACSTDGTVLNSNIGRQLTTYWELSGTTATGLQGTFAYCGALVYTTTMMDSDVQISAAMGESLTGYGELPTPCAGGAAVPGGDQLTFISRADYYTTGVVYTSDGGLDMNNNFVAMSSMDGTNSTLLFLKGTTENCLVVSAGPVWEPVGGSGATETKYQDGTFAGDGLDVTIDSTGDIVTLETPGIFRKFDNTFALVFVSPWLGPGNALRAEYDKDDDMLYVLSDTHITICMVVL